MKLIFKRYYLINVIYGVWFGLLFATPHIVENITASQRADGSKIVDIYYDADCDSLLFIELLLSTQVSHMNTSFLSIE